MSNFKFRLFLLIKLPIAFISGIKLSTLSNNKASLSVKHRWLNQNPFKSIYFAVQAMTAEISTGILVMNKIRDQKNKISMLVVNQQASFSKKGTGKVFFTCNDGEKIDAYLQKAIETKEGQVFQLLSVGKNENGEEVSRFEFTWSIKLK